MNTPNLSSEWDEQWRLQRALNGGFHPADFDDEDAKIQYIKDMILACTDELHEALAEVGWKPWATSRHINREAYVGELLDAWQFLMNLFQVAHVTPEELARLLYQKHLVNWRRIREEYDGVTTKCKVCRRALDDEHVLCTDQECAMGSALL